MLLHSMVIHASASRFLAIRHEYAMEYAMMELQQWAERDASCKSCHLRIEKRISGQQFEGLSLTGLIVMPVFACADKADYLVSAGCTITVKFNAKDEILVYRICIFWDVFRVVMRGSIFPTGLIVMPVFACADKGDYTVSVGCTITVKFNPKASCTASFWLSDFL